MNAIMDYQKDYFLSGDEQKIKPMVLRDIAGIIQMDISTVSRVANSKYIDTPYGVKLLKNLFSEGMKNEEGEDVSTIEIKNILNKLISNENKKKPLADQALSALLKEKGYTVARRTVAKYREQLDIPVARLRKSIWSKYIKNQAQFDGLKLGITVIRKLYLRFVNRIQIVFKNFSYLELMIQ